jgi:hypothetical protein
LSACVYILFLYINEKLIYAKTTTKMGEGKVKENGGVGEFNYNIFDIL